MRGALAVLISSGLLACAPPAAGPPPGHPRIDAHPATRFGEIRRSILELMAARYTVVDVVVSSSTQAAGGERFALFGTTAAARAELIVIVRVSSSVVRVGNVEAQHPDAAKAAALPMATGRHDVALLRVEDDVPLNTMLQHARVLREAGFEHLILSAIDPKTLNATARPKWLETAEYCPFPPEAGSEEEASTTLEATNDGLGNIGSIAITSVNGRASFGYGAAMCLSALPFPPHATGPKYRIRFRFVPQ